MTHVAAKIDADTKAGEGSTLLDILRTNANRYSQAPALLAPGRAALSHAGLLQQVEENVSVLTTLGIRAEDRVVLVLDEGPEMAVGFLSIAALAGCAPLNPSYKEREYDAAFAALSPRAIITSGNRAPLVREIASQYGVALFEAVSMRDQEAGLFTIEPRSGPRSPGSASDRSRAERDSEDRIALLLQTSGTTSRPKLVGLSQANLTASARNIAEFFELSPADRALNIMPLFHIHGLLAALLASLAAGSSVVCCPGFQARRFFEWLQELQPTWYTAVPTMHAAIATRSTQLRNDDVASNLLPTGGCASSNEAKAIVGAHSLRFIRSCSAALPPRLMHELEELFGVPVLEAYGMTEASHQMTCNPLPPALRKPGSVGVRGGAEFTIFDSAHQPLPPGEEGDIVVRGPGVIRSYVDNQATESFVNGWFKTGDIGSVDKDGYLFIKGRAKEIINRGGSKISPYEIEQILLEHPGVSEAAAFAVEDERLGEDVGAAVVPHSSAAITAAELREFVASRLADYKAPQRIAFVQEIPKGPTGKVQRIGMAARLGIAATTPVARSSATEPKEQSDLEKLLLTMWARALGVEHIEASDNFFDLGGDSAAALELLLDIEQVTGTKLSMAALFAAPTVSELARTIEGGQGPVPAQRIAALNGGGPNTPFFCIEAGPLFWRLAKALNDRPFFSVMQPVEDVPASPSIEEIAAFHVRSIRAVQPEGPYFIGGWCMQGVV
ncbi:MAG: AMP-binding protein, partial [Deltaproteobacteria bacterium]|nr:AMP-binding protein [Deltaproteobacteria bacterium]